MISTGLKTTETVLRGGGLVAPVVVGAGLRVDGMLFWPLRLQDSDLHRFLTGKRVSLRLLNSLPIFEVLARSRAEAIVKLLLSVEKDDGEDDPVEELGLDAVPTCRPRRASKGASKRYLGSHVEITVNVDGFEPWTPRVLLNSCTAAVAIEVTDHNMAMLWRIVQVAGQGCSSGTAGCGETPSRGQGGSLVSATRSAAMDCETLSRR